MAGAKWLSLGIYGHGMHDFLMHEIELGTRVAHAIDSKDASGWDALDDLMYEEYRRGQG